MEIAIFIVTAVIAVVGAVAMLLSPNAVHSALYLLVNFAAISVLFLLLRAPFLFVVQLTVYAGAIMVLFLFVMMLLGAERVEDEQDKIAWQRPLALGLGLVLLVESVLVAAQQGVAALPAPTATSELTGAPEQIGRLLFTTYLLPFEITSVILLVAIIGVVVLNRREPSGTKQPSGD
jgi:NADH-quinone oxidoreductase subunit J